MTLYHDKATSLSKFESFLQRLLWDQGFGADVVVFRLKASVVLEDGRSVLIQVDRFTFGHSNLSRVVEWKAILPSDPAKGDDDKVNQQGFWLSESRYLMFNNTDPTLLVLATGRLALQSMIEALVKN